MNSFKFFSFLIFLSLFLGFSNTVFASSLYNDTFDTYSLGNLDTQAGWVASTGHLQVTSVGCYSGSQCYTNSISGDTATVPFTSDNSGSGTGVGLTGTQTAWFKVHTLPVSGQTTELLGFCYHSGCPQTIRVHSDGSLWAFAQLKATIPLDTWFQVTTQWFAHDSTSNPYNFFTYQYNAETPIGSDSTNQGWVDTYNVYYLQTGDTSSGNAAIFTGDSFGSVAYSPTGSVLISSPSSTTTETFDTTNLTVTWDNVDTTIWKEILLQFSQDITGKSSTPVHHVLESSSGSFSVPLSDFAFTQNGHWKADLLLWANNSVDVNTYYLHFTSPGRLSSNYEPNYYLDINFAGLPSAPVSLTEVCTDVVVGGVHWGTWFDIPCQIHNAVAWLFTDDPATLKSLVIDFQKEILTVWPIGYITRFVTILSSTTIVEPPPISYTLGSSTASTGLSGTYSFQVFDHVGTISTVTEDTGAGTRTIWDIFMPFWETVVYLSLFIVILAKLMHSDLGHILEKGQHNSNQSNSSGHKGKYDNIKHYTS